MQHRIAVAVVAVLSILSMPSIAAGTVQVPKAELTALRNEIAQLKARVAALERWRLEVHHADAASDAEGVSHNPDGPTKKWTIWAKGNISKGVLVKDRAARGGRASQGVGRYAFTHKPIALKAGKYLATFRMRPAPGKAPKTGVIQVVVQWQIRGKWRSIASKSYSPSVMQTKRYAAYPLPFTLKADAFARALVAQAKGAVARVERIEIEQTEETSNTRKE